MLGLREDKASLPPPPRWHLWGSADQIDLHSIASPLPAVPECLWRGYSGFFPGPWHDELLGVLPEER